MKMIIMLLIGILGLILIGGLILIKDNSSCLDTKGTFVCEYDEFVGYLYACTCREDNIFGEDNKFGIHCYFPYDVNFTTKTINQYFRPCIDEYLFRLGHKHKSEYNIILE